MAVFLSYASQDAEAARRICNALQAADIEVWFDQSELRGGDAWDQSIRRQIKNCTLFIPVVSRHTHARAEGYFRLEWKLAVDRSHLIMANKPFLLPVVVDDTSDRDEHVPEKFHEVQWTRLPGGETQPAFVERVKRLLSAEASSAIRSGAASVVTARRRPWVWPRRVPLIFAAVVVLVVVVCLAIARLWIWKPAAAPSPAQVTSAAFAPPPHSVAVLPFVNLSGDKDQEYFSDGLTEELLNSLAQINDLQVAARTSSFSFKEHPDIVAVAHKLNVAAVLEGSVRRSGNTVRVTAQLIKADSGFHLWSKTYDRDLGDVLKLQTEIATAVAEALKVTLLGDISQKIELGGTRNPAAFDAFLRGRRIASTALTAEGHGKAIEAYTEAIRFDPQYALAFADRSLELNDSEGGTFERALADARTAISLAPELAEGYYALGVALKWGALEFARADEAFAHAMALAPGSARILAAYSRQAAEYGRIEQALSAGYRALSLDPLNYDVHRKVGIAFLFARHYPEALAAYQTAINLKPDFLRLYVLRGEAQYEMGAYDAARKSCEVARADPLAQSCLARTYWKLGRKADAEGELNKLKSASGDDGAYDYSLIYAQWGDTAQALEWLETALRLRSSDLGELKAEPDFDPLRNEPRFQAVLRALKFPE